MRLSVFLAITASFIPRPSFGVELSVLVQNMQFLSVVGGSIEDMIARATKYGEVLLSQGVNVPDVIGLCETFIQEPTDTLVSMLNTTHPYQLRFFPEPPLPDEKFVDSGLTMLSKYPIESHDFRMFTEANGLDALSAKGVLVALIRLPLSFAVVSVTHQNAGGTDKVFTSQLGTSRDLLRDFVNRNVPSSAQKYTAIVGMGDYNIASDSKTYQEMVSTLAYQTEDPHILLNPDEDGATYPTSNATRRIDYIFKLNAIEKDGCDFSSSNVTRYSVNDWVAPELLSDHLGVSATISIPEKTNGTLSSQIDEDDLCYKVFPENDDSATVHLLRSTVPLILLSASVIVLGYQQ